MATVTSNDSPFINVVRAGPRSGSPVILLHAVSLDLTYWDAQFERLSRTHDVVAFDWPNHGRSGNLPAAQISFNALAKVVASVVEQTAGGPAHIVGLSMGSMVAQHFALTYPERVRSLCLLGSACTFADAVRQGMQDRAAKVRQGGMTAVLEAALSRWFVPEFRGRRPDVIDRVTKTVLACDAEGHAATWDMIAGLDTQERLASLTCPTLVLAGAEDPSTPPAAARLIAERIVGAQVEIIPGASHMAQLEAPEVVSDLIGSFLSQNLGG